MKKTLNRQAPLENITLRNAVFVFLLLISQFVSFILIFDFTSIKIITNLLFVTTSSRLD